MALLNPMRSLLALLEFYAVFNCQRLLLVVVIPMVEEVVLNAVQVVVVVLANAAVNTVIAVLPLTIADLDVKVVPVVPPVLLLRILSLLLRILSLLLRILNLLLLLLVSLLPLRRITSLLLQNRTLWPTILLP